MSQDRGTSATNLIGVMTAVVGLVTALIVLVTTLGANQGGAASHPPTTLTAATQTLPILLPPSSAGASLVFGSNGLAPFWGG